jgi:PAS domain S-box-containing protein
MSPSRRLTKREQEVADLLVQGMLNKEIGGALGISERSVKSYRAKVLKKFGARSVVGLVHLSIAAENSEPRMTWEHDASGALSDVNDRLLEFVGLEKNQLLGDGWIIIVHPTHRKLVSEAWEKSFQERLPHVSPYRLRRADDTYHWVFSVGVPRFNRAGEYTGHFGSLFLIDFYLERWLKLVSSGELLALAAGITLLLASLYDQVRP